VDAKGTILTASSPPATLFGFKAASVVGKNIAQLIDIFAELKTTPAKLTQCLEGLFMRCVHAQVHMAAAATACSCHVLPLVSAVSNLFTALLSPSDARLT
jgi:hypothetical protein